MAIPLIRQLIKISLAFLFFGFFVTNAHAWQHEISVGYGFGPEVEEGYYNRGVILTGKLYKFRPIDNKLIITIDGTVASWFADVNHHKNLTIAALAPAARAYFFDPRCTSVRPYIGMSFGPTYLSAKQFGERVQGAHFGFQSTLEMGTEIGNQRRSLDLNLHFAHYCNAGLFRPNQGINLLYIFTVGYQF